MCKATDNSHKTATTRSKLSSAAQYLVDNDLLQGECLDFGCGKGWDCNELQIDGYDPYYRPHDGIEFKLYDTIMCNFVLNVLQKPMRDKVILDIQQHLAVGGIAYIAVRNDKKNLNGFMWGGTFQTFVELDLPIEKKTSSFVMYRINN